MNDFISAIMILAAVVVFILLCLGWKHSRGGNGPALPAPCEIENQRRAPATKAFVVGKIVRNRPWVIMGVFENEDKAVEACKGPSYFIAPLTLNEELPDMTLNWPGMYFPARERKG